MPADDVLLICHACGAQMICSPTDWEAQRTFKAAHRPICDLGSGGKAFDAR